MNHEPFIRPQQLVTDDERADGIIAGAAPGVSDHVCIPFCESRVFGGVESGIHARENREAPRRRQRKPLPLAESFCIQCIGSQHFMADLGHEHSSIGDDSNARAYAIQTLDDKTF
jgi:hypothetical protein